MSEQSILPVVKPVVIDLLDSPAAPGLSSTNDMPVVVETKPDASNEGKPPELPAVAASEEPKPEDKTISESATEPEKPSASDEPKKESRGVQKRLDELVRQREEAERRAESERQEKERLLAMLEKQVAPKGEPADDGEPQRPTKSEFNDPDSWENALDTWRDEHARWTARREIAAAQEQTRRDQQRREIEDGQRKMLERHNSRLDKFKTEHPDFDEITNRPDVVVPMPVVDAIYHSEQGPALQYYFGQNPDEAKRLLDISNPYLQLLELGKIEAKLAGTAAKPSPTVSAAPRPIKPTVPASETAPKTLYEIDDMETYASQRRKQAGWADPQGPKPVPGTRH